MSLDMRRRASVDYLLPPPDQTMAGFRVFEQIHIFQIIQITWLTSIKGDFRAELVAWKNDQLIKELSLS